MLYIPKVLSDFRIINLKQITELNNVITGHLMKHMDGQKSRLYSRLILFLNKIKK